MHNFPELFAAMQKAREAFVASRTPENREAFRAAKMALHVARWNQRREHGWRGRGRHLGWRRRFGPSGPFTGPGPMPTGGASVPPSAGVMAPFMAPVGPVVSSASPVIATPASGPVVPTPSMSVVVPSGGTASFSGLHGPFDSILDSLGLRDPIANSYPGLPLSEVWKKVWGFIEDHKLRLAGLRSDRKRQELAGRIDKMYRMAADIAPAFRKPDSQIGKRERDKLAQLVLEKESYTKDWRAAKKQVGYAEPDVEEPETEAPAEVPQVQQPTEAGLPWGWIIAGAAGLLLYAASQK
jgi:hypothetical protein